MKTLVVWYSLHGHTDIIAKKIAGYFRAHKEKLIDTADRGEVVSWNVSAHHPEVQLPAKLEAPKYDPKKYDLVIIGTPIWDNATPGTPAVIEYAKKHTFPGKVAFFATCGASEQIAFKELQKLTGKKPLATMDIQDRDVQLKRYSEQMKAICSEFKRKMR